MISAMRKTRTISRNLVNGINCNTWEIAEFSIIRLIFMKSKPKYCINLKMIYKLKNYRRVGLERNNQQFSVGEF